ncbi:raffinose/stachyose/melibiose transport system permease protein [Streptomyces phaeochromogenes]|jgi:raffinose/stachyose/melibiose transport system permease protein|uniref:carbohydrate ABC transporter permease n=1 Tax=Streptomyces TaxID=1883 RepID=UPI001180606A|nr:MULTISPECIES: carbohydrate ABC transporter permease [Streptomyces]MDQ0946921.1 raffinose/stachyose/melibiose transport system permease protein [Streptomyces phaeochromogenes]TRO59002.1 carbohydrate ABC transporter permease [Streptomyces sp. IB201691-2A2]
MTRYRPRTLALELAMIAAALFVGFPVYVLVNLAVRPESDTSSPIEPTTSPTLDNFTQAWQQGALGGALANSVLVTVCSVAVVLAVSSLAAYPLARVTARWSRGTYLLVLLGLVLPFQLAALPLYQTMRDLGLLGTPWALVLFYSGLQVPFTVFLYVGFLRALPRDFEDAALIDGCTPLQGFRYVVLPMLKPITVTALVLNTVAVWNDFFTPLLYLSGSAQQTMPVAIAGFVGQYVTDWNLIFAALVISILPVLLVYFLLQRSIINGFAGGLKG